MIPADSPPTLREARLAALAKLAEWQKLLTHFSLEPDEFAFIPMFVPDDDWASVCQQSLTTFLQTTDNKILHIIATEKPEDLKNLAGNIFDLEPSSTFGAVWIVAPVTIRDEERGNWKSAWREGMARLNQYRNPFRQKFDIPVLLVGGDWTKEIIRDAAPDLWSVRTTVVNVEPKKITLSTQSWNIINHSQADLDLKSSRKLKKLIPPKLESWFGDEPLTKTLDRGIDPEFALREAALLRGQKGKELSLARLLYRAANSLSGRKKFKLALESSEEADQLIYELLNSTKANQLERQIELEGFHGEIKLVKGVLLASLGKFTEATSEFDKAIEILKDLVTNGQSELAYDLALAYGNKGNSIHALGRFYEAAIEYDKTIEILKDLVTSTRSEPANDLATAYLNKGNTLLFLGKFNEAIKEYEKAIEIRKALVENGRGELENELAIVYLNKGVALDSLGKLNDAIREYEKAIEIRKALVENGQGELENELAMVYGNKGVSLKNLGKLDEAIEEYDKSITILKGLVENGHEELANDLATAYGNKGVALDNLGKLNEAIKEHDKAIDIRKALVGNGHSELAHGLATIYGNKGVSLKRIGKLDEAIEEYNKSITILKDLVENRHDELASQLAMTYLNKGNTLLQLGELKETNETYSEAIKLFEETFQRGEVQNLVKLAAVLGSRIDIHRKTKKLELAEKDMQRLHELLEVTKQREECEHLAQSIQAEIDKRS